MRQAEEVYDAIVGQDADLMRLFAIVALNNAADTLADMASCRPASEFVMPNADDIKTHAKQFVADMIADFLADFNKRIDDATKVPEFVLRAQLLHGADE